MNDRKPSAPARWAGARGEVGASTLNDTTMRWSQRIPTEMKERPQWVNWREEERNGKLTKVPYTPGTNRKAASNSPRTWRTFEEALASFRQNGCDGIGYVFSADDGLAGVDLDECANGGIEPWALEIVNGLASYTEWSPSKHGLHIIVRGKLPPTGRRKGRIEMYDSARYFTMTGDPWSGSPPTIESRQAELEALHAKVFVKQAQPAKPLQHPAPVDLDDVALLQKAQSSANGGKFSRLWHGDFSGYESQSEADLALCSLLVFWTGGDTDRVDQLFRQSGLYRSKWDERHHSDGRTYGRATIEKALSAAREFYDPSGNKQDRSDAGTKSKETDTKSDGSTRNEQSGANGGEPTTGEIAFCTPDQIADFYGDVVWTWEGWIPQGHLTLIVGPQGCGKSYFAVRLVGSLTGCIPEWADGTGIDWASEKLPAKVLIVETEEMRGAFVERMDRMGIDRSRYLFGPGDETYIPNLIDDAKQIEGLAVQEDVGAIIIDSLSGGHALKENDAEMRQLLQKYARIAGKLKIPVILVHHPRKRNTVEPMAMTLDRVRGSSTITQFCRSVIGLYRLDEDSNAPVRVEAIKTSFCAPPKPLGFTINSRGLEFCDAPEGERPATRVDAACDLLKIILTSGPKKAVDVREEIESAGMAWSTAKKAKKRLGIVSRKTEPSDGEKAYWEWALPAEE